ncbi:hypothetical protein D3C81_1891980 [compost metagenome]
MTEHVVGSVDTVSLQEVGGFELVFTDVEGFVTVDGWYEVVDHLIEIDLVLGLFTCIVREEEIEIFHDGVSA